MRTWIIFYIFLACGVTKLWWNQLLAWLRLVHVVSSASILDHLFWFDNSCKAVFSLDVGWLFGLNFCWVVWKCRNDVNFNSLDFLPFDGLSVVKLLSGEWLLMFSKGAFNGSWKDWCNNHMLTLERFALFGGWGLCFHLFSLIVVCGFLAPLLFF